MIKQWNIAVAKLKLEALVSASCSSLVYLQQTWSIVVLMVTCHIVYNIGVIHEENPCHFFRTVILLIINVIYHLKKELR